MAKRQIIENIEQYYFRDIRELSDSFYIPGLTEVRFEEINERGFRVKIGNIGANTVELEVFINGSWRPIFTSGLNLATFPFAEIVNKDSKFWINSFKYARDIGQEIHIETNWDNGPEEGAPEIVQELTKKYVGSNFNFNHHTGWQMAVYDLEKYIDDNGITHIITTRECTPNSFNPFNYIHSKDCFIDTEGYYNEVNSFEALEDMIMSHSSHPYYYIPNGEQGFRDTKIVMVLDGNGDSYEVDLFDLKNWEEGPNNALGNYYERLPVFDNVNYIEARMPDATIEIKQYGDYHLGVGGIQGFARGATREKFIMDLSEKLFIDYQRLKRNIEICAHNGIDISNSMPMELRELTEEMAVNYLRNFAENIADHQSSICIEQQSSGGDALRKVNSLIPDEYGERKAIFLKKDDKISFIKRIKLIPQNVKEA